MEIPIYLRKLLSLWFPALAGAKDGDAIGSSKLASSLIHHDQLDICTSKMQKIPPSFQKANHEELTLFRFSQSDLYKSMAETASLKDKVNKVILNYLVEEGFQSAAMKLSEEADISLEVDDLASRYEKWAQNIGDRNNRVEANGRSPVSHGRKFIRGYASITERKRIKVLILKGDISQAIKIISTLYPTVLDANNLLLFKLLRLNLIEMIRKHKSNIHNLLAGNGDITHQDSEQEFLNSVLEFVRENLLNKVTHSMDLLHQLEVTMSLLCFDFDHNKPSHQMIELPEELRNLLNLSLRSECYRAVNKVILDLDDFERPELLYQSNSIDEVSLSLAQVLSLRFQDPYDLDSSDVELLPGQDIVQSIENMISAVPEFSVHTGSQGSNADTEKGPEVDENGEYSRLEEIAKLWLATELILLLEKFIPKKRYFQDTTDGINLL